MCGHRAAPGLPRPRPARPAPASWPAGTLHARWPPTTSSRSSGTLLLAAQQPALEARQPFRRDRTELGCRRVSLSQQCADLVRIGLPLLKYGAQDPHLRLVVFGFLELQRRVARR